MGVIVVVGLRHDRHGIIIMPPTERHRDIYITHLATDRILDLEV